MVAEWEFSYNGLTFGGSTAFGVLDVQGLGSVDMREDVLDIPGTHGSYVKAQYGSARRVVITGDVWYSPISDNMESLIDTLRAAFAPQPNPIPLSFNRHNTVAKRINCVRSRFDFGIDFNYQLGNPTWVAEFLAGDPRIYSDTVATSTIAPPASVGLGATFDIDFSFSFGGGSSGQLGLVNSGMVETFLGVRFYGMMSNPKLTNVSTGEFVRFGLTLGATDYLDVDFGARTVLLNGTGNRYATLDAASTWWSLAPGITTVEFDADAVAGGSAILSYRSAWI